MGNEGQTWAAHLSSDVGGGAGRSGGAAANRPETRDERRARRTAYLAQASRDSREMACSPRTLRRYAYDMREQHGKQ